MMGSIQKGANIGVKNLVSVIMVLTLLVPMPKMPNTCPEYWKTADNIICVTITIVGCLITSDADWLNFLITLSTAWIEYSVNCYGLFGLNSVTLILSTISIDVFE